jgi:hypothetical protein
MPTIVLLLAAALGIGGSPAVAGTFAVEKTFDGRPFEYRMEPAADFSLVHRAEQWRWGSLWVPDGRERRLPGC